MARVAINALYVCYNPPYGHMNLNNSKLSGPDSKKEFLLQSVVP